MILTESKTLQTTLVEKTENKIFAFELKSYRKDCLDACLATYSSDFSIGTVTGQEVRYFVRRDLHIGFPYIDANFFVTKRAGWVSGTKGCYCVRDGNGHSFNVLSINECTS